MSANPGALPGWFRRRIAENPSSGSTRNTGETTASPMTSSTTSQTTTGGGRDDQTPVVVWEAANRMEAEIVAGRLHSEDIPAIIRGESLGTIYGLTTGSLAAATVLVPAALAEKALAILNSTVEWEENEAAEFSDALSSDGDTLDVDSNHQHDG